MSEEISGYKLCLDPEEMTHKEKTQVWNATRKLIKCVVSEEKTLKIIQRKIEFVGVLLEKT